MTVLRDLASLVRVMRRKPVTRRLVCPQCAAEVTLAGDGAPLYACEVCGFGTDTLRDLVLDQRR